ncbi:MAG TPA: 5'-nucleotidase, lipoprotein e(P4) family [Bacteroidales bacterium]|nr:5'-nucleotidase, lipoprotein e(P4) family [Bacteroidales bacterium]
MKTRTLIIAGLLLLTACGSIKTKSSAGAESQDRLLLATLWYQKSAEMKAMYYQCYSNAEAALVNNLAVSEGKKTPAVVMDIDETVLDNSPFQGWQIIENKGFNDQDWTRWVELATADPLPGAVEFTRFADSLGVEVFYVSNRKTTELAPTLANMVRLGFSDADSTHMLLKGSVSSKVERRAQLENSCEILLLIGDNLADLDAVFEKRGADLGFSDADRKRKLFGTKYIVLPNPMYGTWLSELLKKTEGENTRDKLVKNTEGF